MENKDLYLVGPVGSGKKTMIRQLANQKGIPLFHYEIQRESDLSDLLPSPIEPTGKDPLVERIKFPLSKLQKIAETGGWLLLDGVETPFQQKILGIFNDIIKNLGPIHPNFRVMVVGLENEIEILSQELRDQFTKVVIESFPLGSKSHPKGEVSKTLREAIQALQGEGWTRARQDKLTFLIGDQPGPNVRQALEDLKLSVRQKRQLINLLIDIEQTVQVGLRYPKVLGKTFQDLGWIDAQKEKMAEVLIQGLKDPAWEVRLILVNALRSLAKLDSERAREGLSEAVTDNDKRVRQAAIKALAELGEKDNPRD